MKIGSSHAVFRFNVRLIRVYLSTTQLRNMSYQQMYRALKTIEEYEGRGPTARGHVSVLNPHRLYYREIVPLIQLVSKK